MNTSFKLQESHSEILSKPTLNKKEKVGRWSSAQCYYFQSLLQRFGKNWKKIQVYMKNRSLSQIRSHAQKYFEKIGPKKVEEFQRRAKLLEAYETLQKEKQLRQQPQNQTISNQPKPEIQVKQEEESPLTAEAIIPQNITQAPQESINIKEQVKPSESLKEENLDKLQNDILQNTYPFLNNFNFFNGGYLLQIIGQNPEPFLQFRGIQPYVDSPGFRASVFRRVE